MPGKIFISYRRGDDPGYTQALYQRLEEDFTTGALFMDIEGQIKPGDDFVQVLSAQVAACDMLLAVIGPRWAELLSQRNADPDDFVVIEIKAALDMGKRVIPVLVGGATMPRVDILPQGLRPLARRNAVGLRPERFKADCQGLVSALKEQLAAAETERTARTETERKAAEAARLESDAAAASRAAQLEEQAKAQAVAGIGPDEIRKAEEIVNWEFISKRNKRQELRDHLARFPGGLTSRYALSKLEDMAWTNIGSTTPETAVLRDFLDEFPNGEHAEAARLYLATLQKGAVESEVAEHSRVEGIIASPVAERNALEETSPTDEEAHSASQSKPPLRIEAGGVDELLSPVPPFLLAPTDPASAPANQSGTGELLEFWRIALVVCAIIGAVSATWLAIQVGITSFPKITIGSASPAPPKPQASKAYKPLIMIDPGHGGNDGGARRGGISEKDIVLAFSLKLRELLNVSGRYRVLMTRDSDRFVEIAERRKLAEDGGASLFITVHAHQTGTGSTGIEIISLVDTSTEGRLAAKRAILANTKIDGVQPNQEETGEVKDTLADWSLRDIAVIPARTRILVSMLGEYAGARNSARGHDMTNEPSIRALMTAGVSSLLIQLGNIGNELDADQIRSAGWQEELSKSIVTSLDTYFASLHPP